VIRRLLALLLLLALGFGLLRWLGGEPNAAVTLTGDREPRTEPGPRRGPGIAIPLEREPGQPEGERPVLRLRLEGGRIVLPRNREVVLDGGRRMQLPIYRLEADDSAQLADERLRLIGVRIEFFETAGTAAAPRSIPAGELRAAEAIVTVASDEQGRPSIEEDRDIDLRDVVLTTGEQARLARSKLVVGQALVRSQEGGLLVRTADPAEPFTLTRDGERRLELTGEGLDARFPHSRSLDRIGDQTVIQVGRRPDLRLGDARVQALGAMTLCENATSGGIRLHAEQQVQVTLQLQQRPATITGERLDARVARLERDGIGGGEWLGATITGAPVRLAAPELTLHCAQLDVTPAPGGRPYVVTATGAPELTAFAGDRPARFAAERRLHLLRYGERWLQPYGLPAIGTAFDELVLLEGAARIEAEDLHARASDGMTLARGRPASSPISLAGRGRVRIEAAGGAFDGNDGFLLTRDAAETRVRLGPEQAARSHAFTLAQGGQRIDGSGGCRITHREDGDVRLELDSPAEDLIVQLAEQRGELRRLARLDAALQHGALQRLSATGADCGFVFPTDGGPVAGSAVRITSRDPRVIELHGGPAWITRAGGERLHGERIEITRLAGGRIALLAQRSARVAIPIDGASAERLDLDAAEVRLLPWLAAPAAVAWLAAPHPPGVRLLLSRRLGAEVLIATGACRLQRESAGRIVGTATGQSLWMLLREQAGTLEGSASDPATVARVDERGRQTNAAAATIRFASTAGGEWLSLAAVPGRAPVLEFAGTLPRLPEQAATPSGDERHRLVCDGPIELQPGWIRCLGRIALRGLAAGGTEDPAGLRLDAERLLAERDRRTGEVLRLQAIESAELRWSELHAQGTRLTLDLRDQKCVIEDPDGAASVDAPLAHWRGHRAEYFYASFALRAWHSRVTTGRQ
jgi:hypothetical protein